MGQGWHHRVELGHLAGTGRHHCLLVVRQRAALHSRYAKPLENAKRYVPIYIFLVGFVIALVTLFKGLKHVGLKLSMGESYLVGAGIGLVVMVIGIIFIRRLRFDPAADADFHFANVERFSVC